MNLPISFEYYARMGAALSFFSASPVMTMAPESISSGARPAFA